MEFDNWWMKFLGKECDIKQEKNNDNVIYKQLTYELYGT